MATVSKIIVKVDDEIIELTGAEKEAFILDIEARAQERLALAAQEQTQATQRQALFKRLGITADEAALLLS